VKKLAVLALLAIAGWLYLHEPAAAWRGMPAAREPLQLATALPAPFGHEGLTITPLARYTLTAVVLSRERYRYDPAAELAPVDLALGWGPMSVAAVINELSVTQSARWYEYHWANEPPLDPAQISTHSANTHCLPSSPDIRRRLLAVKRHDLVTLTGFLVEIAGPNGYHWRSSLSREDTGGNSCEVMWITEVSSRPL
jgi:hypothetical protein